MSEVLEQPKQENGLAKIEPIKQFFKSEIEKVSITDQEIANYKKRALKLTALVTGLESKEELKKVIESRQFVKNVRLEKVKDIENIKKVVLAIHKQTLAEERRVENGLSEVEDIFKEKEDEIEAAKEVIRKQKEDETKAVINARVKTLISESLVFNGDEYRVGSVSITNEQIEKFSDVEFDSFTRTAINEAEKEKAKKIEQQKIIDAKLKADEILKQQKEQEDRDAEILRKAEIAKLESLRIEQEKKAKELQDKEDALDLDRKKLQAEIDAKKQKEQEEKDAAQAKLDKIAAEEAEKNKAIETAKKKSEWQEKNKFELKKVDTIRIQIVNCIDDFPSTTDKFLNKKLAEVKEHLLNAINVLNSIL